MRPRAVMAATLVWLCALVWPGLALAADPPIAVTASNQQLAEHARQTVADIAPRLRQWAGASPKRIVVEIIDNQAAFARRMDELGAPQWADGLALPLSGVVIVKSPALLGDAQRFDHVLAHELIHLHLGPALRGARLPLWLEEGLAMYLSGESAWGRAPTMAGGVLTDTLPPLADLAEAFPADADGAALAYAQSYYFVSWFLSNFGDETLRRVVAGLAGGLEPSAAFMAAGGRSLGGLEKDFRQAMDSRFSWLAVLTAGGTLWALASLAAGVGLVFRRGRQKARLRAMADSEWAALHGPHGRRWPPPAQRADILAEAGQGRRDGRRDQSD